MRNGVMMALVAAFALGAGVMGTLTWVESRDKAPTTTTSTATASPSQTADATAPKVDSMAAADFASRAKAAQAASGGTGNASGAEAAASIEQPPTELTQGLTGSQASLALANWYYDHDRWPQAIELYRATLTGGIDNANVRTDLGNALRFNGKPQEALVQYQVAQQQDPKHEQSLFNQGGLYAFALNDPKKAVTAWQIYLKRFPKGNSAAAARKFIQQHSNTKAKK